MVSDVIKSLQGIIIIIVIVALVLFIAFAARNKIMLFTNVEFIDAIFHNFFGTGA